MARHETEMHRQRRELLEAMEAILNLAKVKSDPRENEKAIGHIWHTAYAAVRKCCPPCDVGLFGDNRQMDLADRTDVP